MGKGKLSIGAVNQELVDAFDHSWALPQTGNPLTVDGKRLIEDPFLNAFSVIGSILTDPTEVMNGLRRLETVVLSQVPISSKVALQPYMVKDPKSQADDLIKYYRGVGGVAKPKDLGSLVTKALEETEKAYEIKGIPATLTANILPQDFVDELLKKRRPFKDPGAGIEHGECTHRIQWFIVCTSPFYKANCKHSPGAVYERIGHWFFPEVRTTGAAITISNISMWDALVDRFGPPVNQFPSRDDEDFGNSNKLHPWMLNKAKGESNFPLLHAYLTARAQKRVKIELREYLAQKVYGQSYIDLCGEFRRTKDMTKLIYIAQNAAQGADIVHVMLENGDVIATLKRTAMSGIITRDAFFDKRKLRA